MTNTILLLFITTLTSSLLGSLHCLAMCSGLVASCSSDKLTKNLVMYHFGRLLSYTSLGIIASLVGKNINELAKQLDLTNLTALLVGILLILSGLAIIFNTHTSKTNFLAERLQKISNRLSEFIYSENRSAVSQALLVGILTGFLPCGWLYSFVALSATQANTFLSILVMTAFWLGTVPILSLAGFTLSKSISKLGKYQPFLAGMLLILMGLFSLGTHFGLAPGIMPGHDHGSSGHEHHHHHGHGH